ncbi:class I SAM-dependent methyltransferase [Brevundimonas diminuta]|uniref:class I SAM-dependent methyltransferase n=1 Tax=Brevundimonas diminuta TaxID=293 RepID=UPI003D9A6286
MTPPERLLERIGVPHHAFAESGDGVVDDLALALALVGHPLPNFRDVLDFGCGCGRVLTPMQARYPHLVVTGADIDGEAVSWLADVVPGKFVALPHEPPAPFESKTFDLIYGVSVFTHLPEDLQFAWLAELRRIIRPDGFVLLTVHGESWFNPHSWSLAQARGGFHYDESAPLTDGLPGFYKNTYHSRAYIRERWGQEFEVVSHTDRTLQNHQDIIILRPR